ncbi:hypothetical protein [Streptococcus sp.]|uniref:hypothetical protein n=1 Tax=Streptococcus sp. TaxID=1306 RepID=UPI003919E6F3
MLTRRWVLWLLLLFMTSQIWALVMGFTMVQSVLTGLPYTPISLMEPTTASAIASIYLTYSLQNGSNPSPPIMKAKRFCLFVDDRPDSPFGPRRNLLLQNLY